MSMPSETHIRPDGTGGWSIVGELPAGVYATRAEAIAHAVEMLLDREPRVIVVRHADGHASIEPAPDDEAEILAAARRLTPRPESLARMAASPSAEGADLDADPADLF